jgi:hypothetical protein
MIILIFSFFSIQLLLTRIKQHPLIVIFFIHTLILKPEIKYIKIIKSKLFLGINSLKNNFIL